MELDGEDIRVPNLSKFVGDLSTLVSDIRGLQGRETSKKISQPNKRRRKPPPPPPPSSPPIQAGPPLPRKNMPCSEPVAGEDGEMKSEGLSLLEKARMLCAAADDVQRATLEASRRIAAIHGSPGRIKAKGKGKKGLADDELKTVPDIFSRPPSDVPPPQGEGWRRLGIVSVVNGSNLVSAPPEIRKATVKGAEVFVNGERHTVVQVGSGGASCFTLSKEFSGETNMSSMLYLRRKDSQLKRRKGEYSTTGRKKYEHGLHSVAECLQTLSSNPSLPPPPTKSQTPRENDCLALPHSTCEGARGSHSVLPNTQHQEQKAQTDWSTVQGVLSAQRRAQERSKKHRTAASKKAAESMPRPEGMREAVQKVKEARRRAHVRISEKRRHQTEAEQTAARTALEIQSRKDVESATKAAALQAQALVRSRSVAAEKRRKEVERQVERDRKADLKKAKVAALFGERDAEAAESERLVRLETQRRIQREERRRNTQKQLEEEAIIQRVREFEGRWFPVSAQEVQATRSFFSTMDSSLTGGGILAPNEMEDTGQEEAFTIASQCSAFGTYTDEPSPLSKGPALSCGRPTNNIHRRGKYLVHNRNKDGVSNVHNPPRGSGLHMVRSQHEQREISRTEIVGQGQSLELDVGGGVTEDCIHRSYNDKGSDNSTDGSTAMRKMRVPILSPTANSPSDGINGTEKVSPSPGKTRRKVTITPVWKRPVVPLTKPYVPVPSTSLS